MQRDKCGKSYDTLDVSAEGCHYAQQIFAAEVLAGQVAMQETLPKVAKCRFHVQFRDAFFRRVAA